MSCPECEATQRSLAAAVEAALAERDDWSKRWQEDTDRLEAQLAAAALDAKALAAAEARESALLVLLEDLDFEANWKDNLALIDRVAAALSAPRDTAALDAMLAKANADGEFAVLRLMARADKSATERYYVGAKLPEAVDEHDERMLAAERLKTAATQARVVELREVLKAVRVDLARWINKQLKKNNSPDRSLDQLGAIDDALARPDDLEALREFGRKVAMGVLCHPKRDTEPVVEAVVAAVLRGEGT